MAGAGTEVGTQCCQGIPEEGETVLPRKVRVVYREKGTPRLDIEGRGEFGQWRDCMCEEYAVMGKDGVRKW